MLTHKVNTRVYIKEKKNSLQSSSLYHSTESGARHSQCNCARNPAVLHVQHPKIDLAKCMHVFGEAVRSLIMTKHICCLFNFHSLNRRNLSCSTSQKSLLPKCMHVFGEAVRSLNMTKQISRHKQQGFSHNYSENCYITSMQANNVDTQSKYKSVHKRKEKQFTIKFTLPLN